MYVCMYVCKYRGIYFAKSKLRLKSAELAAAQGKDAHASHRRLPSSHLVFDAVSEVGLYNAAIAILKNDPQLQCWVRCPPYPPIVSVSRDVQMPLDLLVHFGTMVHLMAVPRWPTSP